MHGPCPQQRRPVQPARAITGVRQAGYGFVTTSATVAFRAAPHIGGGGSTGLVVVEDPFAAVAGKQPGPVHGVGWRFLPFVRVQGLAATRNESRGAKGYRCENGEAHNRARNRYALARVLHQSTAVRCRSSDSVPAADRR